MDDPQKNMQRYIQPEQELHLLETPVRMPPVPLADHPKQGTDGLEGNIIQKSYAETLQAPTDPNPITKIDRHGKEDTKVRYATHNRMPTIIFKASDYYGAMADLKRINVGGA